MPVLKLGEEMKTYIDIGGDKDNETLEAVYKE